MKMECRFCGIVNGDNNHQENEIIYSNEKYFSIASLGTFIEGWLLVIPKKHACSMKDNYQDPYFIDFVNKILDKLGNKYGKIVAFEHGANKTGSATSCGTDHAHLHLVPLENSLYNLLLDGEADLGWERCRVNDIAETVINQEYLFCYDFKKEKPVWDNPEGLIHILKTPISQFFRMVLAKQQGCFAEANYKVYNNIDKTIYSKNKLIELFSKSMTGDAYDSRYK